MKIKILVIAIAISATIVNAQNEIDALRYSTHELSGTARYSAMGGAFGSLGGEFSGLSSNPAGIGMYQFSELSFTPCFNLNSTKSYYNNYNLSSYKSKVSIGNLGLVFTLPQKESDWRRFNIGIGWNQLANFNNTINIKGINSTSSIVDRIIAMTNGTTQENLTNAYSVMAWETFLIDPLINNNGDEINGEYISNFSTNPKLQSKLSTSLGGMNEFVFSLGSSYQEKIYIGATIGVPTFDYYEYSEYSENEISDTLNNLREMLLTEEISAYGTGYNLKIGAIYRFSEEIKIGGSLHSPTFFSIEEDYNTSLTTIFKDSSKYYSMGYLTPFSYNLITPLKANISASTRFNNIIISGEYELIDYSTAEYFTADFEEENTTIKNIYQNTENVKIGAEVTIKPFVLRAGYSKYGSASMINDLSKENFSYGLGLNNGAYFIDVAYVLTMQANEQLLYSGVPISLENTQHKLLLTLGFRY
ncbi:MAG: hypothetical protein CMD14_01200 [Flavobacteriales bacterium]|nr:hypothetical protein [Flavobacteriales bacterium]|tara:strand:+ start:455 stop:1876 length:1422 start_codon:yes stop_codon:yes gene_type:complete